MPSRPPSTPSDTTRGSPSSPNPPHLLGSASYRRPPTAPRPTPGSPREPGAHPRQQGRRPRAPSTQECGEGTGGTPAGIEAAAVIPATPEPVTTLTAQVSGETAMARIELRWATPALGRVVVYESSTVPEHAATGR